MAKDSVILERRYVPAGTIVIRQDEKGNCAYLVQSGSVSVYTETEGKTVELARLATGQIFGEMALIFDEPRTASVKAVEDCNLIVLTRDTLKQKLDKSDPTIKALVTMLMQRIVSSNNTVMNKKGSLEDLNETARIIYQNVSQGLKTNQRRTFENAVLPKLEEFLNAVRAFRDRYSE